MSSRPSLFFSRWTWFNRRAFDLPLVVCRLNSRGDQGLDVSYEDIVTAIVNHVTSFNVYYDWSVDHLAVRLQIDEEVMNICEFSYQVVLGSWRLKECGCTTLALAAVHLTLKDSLSSFIQTCTQLLTDIKSSSKLVAKLCSFMNKYNQTYLLFFVSDTDIGLENDDMTYQSISEKREALESILLERFHEANDNNREDANIVESHLSALIDQPANGS